MPKISNYQVKQTLLSENDKWIGTDSSGSVTKNFTPEGMAQFINETDFVTTASQFSFRWRHSAGDRDEGSISFAGYGGNGTNLSDLTTFLISDKSAGGSYILDYLLTTVGTEVIMVDVADPNNFVIAGITSIVPNVTYPGYNDLTWTVLAANGLLDGDGVFAIANYTKSAQGSSTLDSVAQNDPVTGIPITTGGLTSDGDLVVLNGSKTDLSDEVEIKDNFPLINSDQTGLPTENAGITVHRGDYPSRGLRWEETEKRWEMEKDAGGWVPIGEGAFFHDQGLPSSVWSITHNLGKFPNCAIVDSGGTTVKGQITYIDQNSLTITFVGAFSGSAYLN